MDSGLESLRDGVRGVDEGIVARTGSFSFNITEFLDASASVVDGSMFDVLGDTETSLTHQLREFRDAHFLTIGSSGYSASTEKEEGERLLNEF